jgi:hypothetical protein
LFPSHTPVLPVLPHINNGSLCNSQWFYTFTLLRLSQWPQYLECDPKPPFRCQVFLCLGLKPRINPPSYKKISYRKHDDITDGWVEEVATHREQNSQSDWNFPWIGA